MSLEFEVGDRFLAAAEEWGDRRMMDTEDALESKAEQALLEIEHLVADAYEVEFDVDGHTVVHEPTDELDRFLGEQAAETGLDRSTLLKLHVDLFARAFLEEARDEERPPDAPRRD
ncbi:MAG: hypothetical protein ABEH78_08210 [Haloferacaceae archaeon]